MLNDYVDGSMDPSLAREFDEFSKHLAGCHPCQIVVDNVRNTIQLYREGHEHEIPDGLRTRLFAAIQKKWEEKKAAE